jgi:hypothetical protein
MNKLLLAGAFAVAASIGGTAAHAAFSDVVQAPTGYFVPTDAQKYDFPYYRANGDDWTWQQGAIAG